VWVADEFMAVLDRTAAKIIAYSVQKTARKAGATVIVATTHTDMVPDLNPDALHREALPREAAHREAACRSLTAAKVEPRWPSSL
jgi:ABC-type ATPase with predicted acetyltransferase domain